MKISATLMALAMLVIVSTDQASADVIGYEDFDGGAVNLTGTSNVHGFPGLGGDFTSVFGIVNGAQNGGMGMPALVADDSVQNVSGQGVNAGDTFGIAGGATTAFFAMHDMDAPPPAGAGLSDATWTFDISSALSLDNIQVDLAALGNFEIHTDLLGNVLDNFRVEAQLDGGGFLEIFRAVADETANKSYRAFDGGFVQNLDDPLALYIDGSSTAVGFLDKSDATSGAFDTYTSTLFAGQSGSTMDIRMVWEGSPGPFEPMGMDNITINGSVIPEPSSCGLLCLAALIGVSRRRRN